MAREVIEKLTDDLEGGDATETVKFGLDGTSYEIDLNRRNAAGLRKALDRYVKAARRTAGRRTAGGTRSARSKASAAKSSGAARKRDYDLAQLREWARSNGVAVPSRGRIPQVVVDQYKSATRR